MKRQIFFTILLCICNIFSSQVSVQDNVKHNTKNLLAILSLGAGGICLLQLNADVHTHIKNFLYIDSPVRNNVAAMCGALGFFALARWLWPASDASENPEKPTWYWESDKDKENWAHPSFHYIAHEQKPTESSASQNQQVDTTSDNEDYPQHIYQLVFLEN